MENIYQLDSTGIAANNKREQFLQEAGEYRYRIWALATRNPDELKSNTVRSGKSRRCLEGEVVSDIHV
jgi:hypothetical protein